MVNHETWGHQTMPIAAIVHHDYIFHILCLGVRDQSDCGAEILHITNLLRIGAIPTIDKDKERKIGRSVNGWREVFLGKRIAAVSVRDCRHDHSTHHCLAVRDVAEVAQRSLKFHRGEF